MQEMFKKLNLHLWVTTSVGGPLNLLELLNIFQQWSAQYQETRPKDYSIDAHSLSGSKESLQLLHIIQSGQRALLGTVRSNLRAVKLVPRNDSAHFSFICYVNGECSQDDERIMNNRVFDINDSLFEFYNPISYKIVQLDCPTPIPEKDFWLFCREESPPLPFAPANPELLKICEVPSRQVFHIRVQHALLGRAGPHLRAVKVDFAAEPQKLSYFVYFDCKPQPHDLEQVQAMIEASAYPGYAIEQHIEEIDSAHKIPLVGRFVYLRNENIKTLPPIHEETTPLLAFENYQLSPPEQVDDDLAWLLAWYEVNKVHEYKKAHLIDITLSSDGRWHCEGGRLYAQADILHLGDELKIWREKITEKLNPALLEKYQEIKTKCNVSSDFGWFLRWCATVPKEVLQSGEGITIHSSHGEIDIDLNFQHPQFARDTLRPVKVRYDDNDYFRFSGSQGFSSRCTTFHLFKMLKAFRIWTEFQIQPAFFSPNLDFKDIELKNKDLEWLVKWNQYHCDNDWEHCTHGIVIHSTHDPVGWCLKVDLRDSELAELPFTPIDLHRSNTDWITCNVAYKEFCATCSPQNILEALAQFRKWAEPAMNATIAKFPE